MVKIGFLSRVRSFA
jgi:hypothetical protein